MFSKKAQAWGIDVMIAVTLFSLAIVAFFLYSMNYSQEGVTNLQTLEQEGEFIAESLLSEGYPLNWNAGNVEKIGLLSNGKINETKLENFYNLESADYTRTKAIFNTKYDYYFFMSENMTFSGNTVLGIGELPAGEETLARITRMTIYKDKPVAMYVYVWE